MLNFDAATVGLRAKRIREHEERAPDDRTSQRRHQVLPHSSIMVARHHARVTNTSQNATSQASASR